MGKLPFMPFYPKDWQADTRVLTAEARGGWIDLLCHLWQQPCRGEWTGTLPQVSRVCGIDLERMRPVITEFEQVAIVEWHGNETVTLKSRRIVRDERERELARNRIQRFRVKESATQVKRKSNAVEVRSQKSEVINTNNIPPENPPKGAFDLIWSKYPNKDGKKSAERSFKGSVKTMRDWLDIQNALSCYLKSERVQKHFIKNGSTWFNNWRDWINYTETKNGAHVGKSIFVQAAERERAQRAVPDREEPSAGEVLARVRNLPSLPVVAGAAGRAGSTGHGRALETVQENHSLEKAGDRGSKP